jgi:Flp pilus assembly pilin Flp
MSCEECRNPVRLTILRIVIARFLRNLRVEEGGQDMVEYVLLLGFIVLAAVAVMTSLRVEISGIWSTITSALSSAVASS